MKSVGVFPVVSVTKQVSPFVVCFVALFSFQFFKAIGDVVGVAGYMTRFGSRNSSDWSGLYLQLNVQHSVETCGYRWENFKESLLCCVDVQCEALFVTSEFMGLTDVSGEEKAAFLKKALGFSAEYLLMEELGRRNLCLLCLESANEWELVVPITLVEKVILKEVRRKCR
jgi:hypothetical protein